jgi:hypothetical protein
MKGSEKIRKYWKKAYGHVKSADLELLSWSWDEPMRRLTVWWRLNTTRASGIHGLRRGRTDHQKRSVLRQVNWRVALRSDLRCDH